MSGTDFEKKFKLHLGLLLDQKFSQLSIDRTYVNDLRQLIESDCIDEIHEFTLKFGPKSKDILVNELVNNTRLATLDISLF